jgi:hypothetical protein
VVTSAALHEHARLAALLLGPAGTPLAALKTAASKGDDAHGYRASRRLIANRESWSVTITVYGVPGSDAASIVESEGFRRVLRIGLQMRDQLVMCSAQSL